MEHKSTIIQRTGPDTPLHLRPEVKNAGVVPINETAQLRAIHSNLVSEGASHAGDSVPATTDPEISTGEARPWHEPVPIIEPKDRQSTSWWRFIRNTKLLKKGGDLQNAA